MRHALRAAILALVLTSSTAFAQNAPTEWDGLVRVNSRNFDVVYLAPGADFSGYTKVMLDPTEVAFRRNWLRDFNRTAIGLNNRISDDEARRILESVQTGVQDVFAQAYRQGGFEVVTTPGPDVLRLRTAITDLDIAAPDTMTPGRRRTFGTEAGRATIVIEARDSMSGAILGWGVDRQTAGDNSFLVQRNRVTNRADFGRVFRRWADLSVQALNPLRQTPAPAAPATGE